MIFCGSFYGDCRLCLIAGICGALPGAAGFGGAQHVAAGFA